MFRSPLDRTSWDIKKRPIIHATLFAMVLLASFAVAAGAASGHEASPDVYVATRLAPSDTRGNMDPAVSGDRVVWRYWDSVDNDYEVYTWKVGDSSPTQLTNNAVNDDLPRVSGDRVVWKGYDGTDYEIFTWTPSGGTVQITNNAYDDDIPQVSGDRVVWKGYDGTDYEIYTWVAGDTEPTRLTDNAYDDDVPQVSGNRVVWKGSDGTDNEIFTWTLSGGVAQITNNAYDDTWPRVSGDRIVWQGSDGTDYEVFTWEPVGGTVQVTSNDLDDLEPQVSGDRVVWLATPGLSSEVFTWKAGDSGVTQLTDDTYAQEDVYVSGDRLVWKGWDGADREIYTQVIGQTAVKVTNNSFDSYDPLIDGDRLVWFADDPWGGTSGVYTGVPSAVVISGLSPNHGTAAGGTEMVITGKGFTGATSVKFSGMPVAFTVNSGTQITATTPRYAAGFSARVTVTAPEGVSPNNDYNGFVYEPSTDREVFTVTRVTSNSYDDLDVQISGDRLAWYGFDGTDYEIYTWVVGDGAPTQLTFNDYNDYSPQVSGDRVAWYGYQGDAVEIYTWAQGDSAPTEAPDTGTQEQGVVVSGNRLAWQTWDGNDWEIFTWVVGDPTATQVTDNEYADCGVKISGDRLVWEGFDGHDTEIFTWKVGDSGPTQLTSNEFDDACPQVSGNRVAWCGYDTFGLDQDIFTWTPTGGTVQLTDDNVKQENPQVYGNFMMWEGYDEATSTNQIYGWYAFGGTMMLSDPVLHWDLSSPQVSALRSVWRCGGHGVVETWTTQAGLGEVRLDGVWCSGPVVSGDLIAFYGYDQAVGSNDIYLASPASVAVKNVAPDYGPTSGGTEVTVTGAGFTDASAVTFGENPAASFTVVSDGEITATSPAGSAGVANVRVQSPLGLSPDTAGDDFTYYGAAPVITVMEPARGPLGGGNKAIISGSDFSGVTAIDFGGTAAAYVVDSAGQITATAPGHVAGNVQVHVTAGGGVSVETGASNYEYVDAPTITGRSETGGPYGGGTTVVITGTSFTGVTEVEFGPARVADYTVDSATQITATSPNWWWGGKVQVKVTAVGGASAYAVGADFTYTTPVPTEDFVTTKVQSDAVEQYNPQVDGSRIVWQAFDGSDSDIYTWTPTGGAVMISNNVHNDLYPQVSGDRVVWQAYDGNDYGIVTWTPTGGLVQLTSDSYDDCAPQVSGDRVVWMGMDAAGTKYQVEMWTPTEGLTVLAADEDYYTGVQVSGDRVVFQSYDNQVFEIYTWTPTEGTHQISADGVRGFAPQVSGDRVVWRGTDAAGNDYQIFTWTPSSGMVQLTLSANHSYAPQVSGDRLVWHAWDGHDYAIVTWTPTDGQMTVIDTEGDEINPQLDGDRLVWQGYDGHDYEIVTWTPSGGAVRLTDSQYHDLYPQVSGDRIVWQGMDPTAHYFEVNTAVPDAPLILGSTPDLGLASGGGKITILGRNFIAVKGVSFGGVPAENFSVDSPSQLTVTTPAHEGGTVKVEVATDAGINPDNGASDDFVYLTPSSAEQSAPQITYVGTWSTVVSSSASGGSYATVNTNGSGALIKFLGTGLQLKATAGAQLGIGFVRLDDGAEVPVDFYSAAITYKKTVYDTGTLTPGEHTLYVRYSGTKNAKSTGYAINVDSLQMIGSMVQAPALVRHQQDDGNVKYIGDWTTSGTWSASGGSFAYANGPGAALNVVFDGSYLAWYATTGAGFGKARVTLDGGTPFLVDLYSPTVKYKQRVYQTGLLVKGAHTLSIYWVGEKNYYAAGYRVDVDTFDVVGDLTAASDPVPYTWLYQQTDSKLSYLGSWGLASSKYASGGSLFTTSSATAAVVVNFTGTSCSLIARTDSGQGVAKVSVDGAPAVTVDLYSPTTAYQRNVFTTSDLKYAPHTIAISRADTKNAKSTGYAINVDALRVTGTLAKAPVTTRYQQTDAKLVYAGSWLSGWTWSASGGSFGYAGSAGAEVTVKFNGTYLSWLAKTGPGFGKAKVTLDGGTPFYVDLYGWSDLYKQTVYSTGLLDAGDHTLTIQWSGTKNAAARSTQINVDALDIVGTLR
jgi:hypothetical protein